MRIFFLTLAFFFFAISAPQSFARTETIVAVVNEDAISMSDMNDRMKLILMSSGLANTEEIRSKIAPQVINSLIEEQLMLQEARRLEIDITREDIDKGLETIAQQNNFTLPQFMQMIKRGGINVATMERQIRAQLSWTRVVQKELRPRITITDSDINSYIQRLQLNKGKTEYLAAEIFLPVDDPEQEANISQLARRLVGEVRSGKAPFFKLAQQFSKAAGAAQGGDIGWVQQGQLPEELDGTLNSLEKNSVSDPVRSLSGYHILLLRDTRQITDETIPPPDQVTAILGLERLERMQRRYLLDLKSSAFIENRVGS